LRFLGLISSGDPKSVMAGIKAEHGIRELGIIHLRVDTPRDNDGDIQTRNVRVRCSGSRCFSDGCIRSEVLLV
jgi:hypothetical protein